MLVGCATTSGPRIDNVPMYGQPEVERPPELMKADRDFIKKIESELGSREEASKLWWTQAEKFMAQGNLDYAMRRYNQSWLLNPNNYQPYWGFARVVAVQGKIDESLKYLAKSKELVDDPFQEVSLLSDMGTMYSTKAEETPADSTQQKKYFELANNSFKASLALEKEYAPTWRRWAFSLYEQGRYNEAWIKVSRARELKAHPFPESFLKALNSKMPEPK